MNTETASEWGSRSHIRVLALMVATALGIYLCYRMALPFVPALTWALALAVLFMPVHRWLESTAQQPNLAASRRPRTPAPNAYRSWHPLHSWRPVSPDSGWASHHPVSRH